MHQSVRKCKHHLSKKANVYIVYIMANLKKKNAVPFMATFDDVRVGNLMSIQVNHRN